MFMKLSEREPFGHPIKFRSAVNAGLKKDEQTVLLMHMDGENDGVVFKDSANDKITAPVNVVTKTTEKMFGTASAFFANGSLTIPSSNDFYFDGAFTIDFWAKPSDITGARLYFGRTAGGSLSGGDLYMYYSGGLNIGGFGSGEISTGVVLTVNEWQHIAVVHDGTNLMVAVNGVFGYTAVKPVSYTNEGDFKIGHPYNVSPYAGYMDEFRVSKGVARWTDNFTPPTNAY